MAKFVAVGSINYDLLLEVDVFPRPHEKVRARGFAMCAGGSAANTAYWLAKLGHDVDMVGAVGDDYFGQLALESLRTAGGSIDHVKVVPNARTGVGVIASSRNEKRMMMSAGPPLTVAIEAVAASRLEMDYVHVASRPTAELAAFCARAKDRGAVLSVELNGRDMSLLARHADIAFLNHDEWRRLTGEEALSWEPASRFVGRAGRVIVTMGPDGATAIEPDAMTHCPTRRVEVVDRTGGGDAFNAGFLAAVAQGVTTEESLANGLRMAASIIGVVGARA